MFPIKLLGVKTYSEKSARNHEVIFDKNFTFCGHKSVISSSCIYHIRDIRRILRHLNLDSTKLLVNALVSSCLNFCNSVLPGIADTDLAKVKRILNRLAHVVTKSPPLTHSVPLLCSLLRQPLKYRVHFKIYLVACKALYEEQPVYLHSLLAIFSITFTEIKQRLHCVGSLGLRPMLASGHLGLAPLLFGTAFHYLSAQPPQLLPSGDVSNHIFLTWPPSLRHQRVC